MMGIKFRVPSTSFFTPKLFFFVSSKPHKTPRTNPSRRKATQAEEQRKNILNKGHFDCQTLSGPEILGQFWVKLLDLRASLIGRVAGKIIRFTG
jgi:hypothetical protein